MPLRLSINLLSEYTNKIPESLSKRQLPRLSLLKILWIGIAFQIIFLFGKDVWPNKDKENYKETLKNFILNGQGLGDVIEPSLYKNVVRLFVLLPIKIVLGLVTILWSIVYMSAEFICLALASLFPESENPVVIGFFTYLPQILFIAPLLLVNEIIESLFKPARVFEKAYQFVTGGKKSTDNDNSPNMIQQYNAHNARKDNQQITQQNNLYLNENNTSSDSDNVVYIKEGNGEELSYNTVNNNNRIDKLTAVRESLTKLDLSGINNIQEEETKVHEQQDDENNKTTDVNDANTNVVIKKSAVPQTLKIKKPMDPRSSMLTNVASNRPKDELDDIAVQPNNAQKIMIAQIMDEPRNSPANVIRHYEAHKEVDKKRNNNNLTAPTTGWLSRTATPTTENTMVQGFSEEFQDLTLADINSEITHMENEMVRMKSAERESFIVKDTEHNRNNSQTHHTDKNEQHGNNGPYASHTPNNTMDGLVIREEQKNNVVPYGNDNSNGARGSKAVTPRQKFTMHFFKQTMIDLYNKPWFRLLLLLLCTSFIAFLPVAIIVMSGGGTLLPFLAFAKPVWLLLNVFFSLFPTTLLVFFVKAVLIFFVTCVILSLATDIVSGKTFNSLIKDQDYLLGFNGHGPKSLNLKAQKDLKAQEFLVGLNPQPITEHLLSSQELQVNKSMDISQMENERSRSEVSDESVADLFNMSISGSG